MSRPEPNTYLHPNYRGWHNAPPFRCYAAAQWGGDGAVFFGVKFNGEVVLTIEDPRGGLVPLDRGLVWPDASEVYYEIGSRWAPGRPPGLGN